MEMGDHLHDPAVLSLGKAPRLFRYPLDGPRSLPRRCGEVKNLLRLPRTEPRPAGNLLPTLNYPSDLPRLLVKKGEVTQSETS
jgi:hypothetical protein